jgi:hypothetical protein
MSDMKLSKRVAELLETFVAAGHHGVDCTADGAVGELLRAGLVELVERGRYRVTKDGKFFATRVEVAPPATDEERVAELLESCDGASLARFGHASYRAEGDRLVCLACGAQFSPWAPGASARAALRELARGPKEGRRTRRSAAAGAAVLDLPKGPAPRSATRGVRFWYASEGGEVLSFDAGPLTPVAAAKLLDQHTDRRWECVDPEGKPGKRYAYTRRSTSACLAAAPISWRDRAVVRAGDEHVDLPEGARPVVLPSQVPDVDAWCRMPAGEARAAAPVAQLGLFAGDGA